MRVATAVEGIAINAGSSSVRVATFHCRNRRCEVLQRWREPVPDYRRDDAMAALRGYLTELPLAAPPAMVVHRFVHGGARTQPAVVERAVEAELETLGALAPLHNPPALAWLRAARAQWPQATPIAAFDTAFYATLPPQAATYALPASLCERFGIKRYGFHGLAHASMWRQWHAAQATPPVDAKVISLQLGSGCSITATRDGVAVDTSMGFSPLEGLVMATRPGDIDAGVLLHLQRAARLHVDEVDALLNHDAGLRGLSGRSGDMRALMADASAPARLAIAVYCYRARKYIGAYAAALGGVDAILFGGGVGEHAASIRRQIVEGLAWCGVELDAAANERAVAVAAPTAIHRGRVGVWVVPVDEEHALAQAAAALLATEQGDAHDLSSGHAH